MEEFNWNDLLESDRRFTLETYRFMQEALQYAIFVSASEESDEDDDGDVFASGDEGHVTGQELCYAAAEYAVREYGYLAKDVLAQLGLRKTSDFGDVVYNMIRFGLMAQSDRDRREDFDDVFDLGEELKRLFKFNYSKKSR